MMPVTSRVSVRVPNKAVVVSAWMVVMSVIAVAARQSTAEEILDDGEQFITAAIATAAAIQSNEASNETDRHNPWCWTRGGRRDTALAQIAEEQSQQGNVDNAVAAAVLIANHSARAEAFAGMVKEQAAKIETAELQDLVKKAEAATDLIADDSCLDATLSKLAAAQGIAGRLDAAFLTLDSISDGVMRDLTEYEVGNAQVAAGKYAVVDRLKSPLVIIMVLGEAAFREAEAGHKLAARQMIVDAGHFVQDVMPVLLAADAPRGMMDSAVRVLPFYLLMKAQVRLGDAAGVGQTGENLSAVLAVTYGNSGDIQSETVEAQAEAHAWAGNEAIAVATANELEDANRREALLEKIAEILHP